MLESALLSAVIALTATTAGLISVGRRPLGRLRVRLAMPVAVIALLIVSNAPTEGIVVGSAIAAIGLLLPRNWYSVGAWFFASLVVAFVLYAVFLARATVLLGGEQIGRAHV